MGNDPSKHYVTIFMGGYISPDSPPMMNNEPHKCESWDWISWAELKSIYFTDKSQLFDPLNHFIKDIVGGFKSPIVKFITATCASETISTASVEACSSTESIVSTCDGEELPSRDPHLTHMESLHCVTIEGAGMAAALGRCESDSPPTTGPCLLTLGQLNH